MGAAGSQPATNKRSEDIAFLLRHTNFPEEKLCRMQSAFLEDAVDGSISRQSFVDMFTAAFFPSNPLGSAQQLGQQVATKALGSMYRGALSMCCLLESYFGFLKGATLKSETRKRVCQ